MTAPIDITDLHRQLTKLETLDPTDRFDLEGMRDRSPAGDVLARVAVFAGGSHTSAVHETYGWNHRLHGELANLGVEVKNIGVATRDTGRLPSVYRVKPAVLAFLASIGAFVPLPRGAMPGGGPLDPIYLTDGLLFAW